MKQLALLLFFFLSTTFLIFGQKFINDPIEVDFYYPVSNNAKQRMKTYVVKVVDREGTLKKENINPFSIALNKMQLPDLIRSEDSADLRIYLLVGAYELIKSEPYIRKEYIQLAENVEIPKRIHYQKITYRLPIYAHIYDCNGTIIWAAKADQDKVFYFGDYFEQRNDLEAAWKEAAPFQNQLAIEDGIIGQVNLWTENMHTQFGHKKQEESLNLLLPKFKEQHPAFYKGVRMAKTIFRKLGQKNSHQAMITWTLPVINYWKKILPNLEKKGPKFHTAGLYNLALLYYGIDQMEEARHFAEQAVAGKEHKYVCKTLIINILKTEKYFMETGFSTRQIYNACNEFKFIDPDEIKLPKRLLANNEINPSPPIVKKIEDSPKRKKSNILTDIVDDVTSDFKSIFTRKESLVDGMVFHNNGQLIQGTIIGDLNRAKILAKGILFLPFKEENEKNPLPDSIFYKPSELKRFVSKDKVYDSQVAGKYFFNLVSQPSFMEVLEDGPVKLYKYEYRKRSFIFMWLIPHTNTDYRIKLPQNKRVKKLKNIDMVNLLKIAPPVLEKYKRGAYGNTAGKRIVTEWKVARHIIRDFNAFIHARKEKANTGGFKVN